MPEPSNAELVKQAQAGRSGAFDRLVERHMRGVYALAYSFVRNHSDADDLTQDVFIRAFAGLKRFRGRAAFGTWLYRIAHNVCTNYVRRCLPSARLTSDPLPSEGGRLVPADAALSPPEELSLAELREDAERAVGALPRKLRVALELVVNQGLSHKEAAKVIGCRPNTVSWRVFRAREVLMEELADHVDPGA
jgi:RNA polymerase sigma-70 factor (ECF subfamily)